MFPEHFIQKFNELATPFYFYNQEVLHTTLKQLTMAAKSYGYQLHYALKANANPAILSTIYDYGLGADCVSENEIERAIKIGFPSDKIVFAGVGKTDIEIRKALKYNIFCFNCESLMEIEVIHQLAVSMGVRASIALRINPEVDPHTHPSITTGLGNNKFGIAISDLDILINRLKHYNHLKLIGLHVHIGSQITDMEVFRKLCEKVNHLQTYFLLHDIRFQHINLGGGLGIDYWHPEQLPDFQAYFSAISHTLKIFPNQTVHFEPGRSVVGPCGSLITRVIYTKKSGTKNFAITDAGFNDLLRPALYQAYHKIENLTSKGEPLCYDVAGPLCESTDVFGQGISLPLTQRGDILAIHSAGAYGEVMASMYNLRELPQYWFSSQLVYY